MRPGSRRCGSLGPPRPVRVVLLDDSALSARDPHVLFVGWFLPRWMRPQSPRLLGAFQMFSAGFRQGASTLAFLGLGIHVF